MKTLNSDFDLDLLFTEEGIAQVEKEIEEDNRVAEEVKIAKEIEEDKYVDCGRCSGAGKLQTYHYVSGGICFKCDGVGKLLK